MKALQQKLDPLCHRMLSFVDLSQETPFLVFRKKYDKAFQLGQKNIEAGVISSYCKKQKEVNSRFVNIKFIEGSNFIFFTNYKSPKSLEFDTHNQVILLFYWNSINTQIRIKANIRKAEKTYCDNYFKNRDKKKMP